MDIKSSWQESHNKVQQFFIIVTGYESCDITSIYIVHVHVINQFLDSLHVPYCIVIHVYTTIVTVHVIHVHVHVCTCMQCTIATCVFIVFCPGYLEWWLDSNLHLVLFT